MHRTRYALCGMILHVAPVSTLAFNPQPLMSRIIFHVLGFGDELLPIVYAK